MGKNFTDLTPDELKRIVTLSFAARGRVATDVSFAVGQEYDQQNRATGGYCLDSVRVTWEDAKPAEPNPRTA